MGTAQGAVSRHVLQMLQCSKLAHASGYTVMHIRGHCTAHVGVAMIYEGVLKRLVHKFRTARCQSSKRPACYFQHALHDAPNHAPMSSHVPGPVHTHGPTVCAPEQHVLLAQPPASARSTGANQCQGRPLLRHTLRPTLLRLHLVTSWALQTDRFPNVPYRLSLACGH